MPDLADAINSAPRVHDQARAAQVMADLDIAAQALPSLAATLAKPTVRGLLAGVASGSPYLTTLMTRDAERLARVLHSDPAERLAAMGADLESALAKATVITEAMRDLRRYKSEAALIIGLADLGGVWPVMQVTRRLSQTADAALQGAVRFLFRQAAAKGDWLAQDNEAPELNSGYIVLGMGKYGAFELNYSSDIDLIVFYDLERLRLRKGLEPSTFFVRLTRDLVRLIDERTADGYVFRVDLRLRPDAGATQVALSTEAALICRFMA